MKVIYVLTTAKYLVAELLKEAIAEQTAQIKEIVREDPSRVEKTDKTLKFIWDQRIRIAPTKERGDAHPQFWFPLGLNAHYVGVKGGYSLSSWGSCWTQVPGVKGTAFLLAEINWPNEVLWRLEALAKTALTS